MNTNFELKNIKLETLENNTKKYDMLFSDNEIVKNISLEGKGKLKETVKI